MERWVRVCSSWEEEAEADREFWLRFSPEERVALVEPANADYSRFVGDLVRRNIRALICGVHAVAYYSKPRYTEHTDVFIAPEARALVREIPSDAIHVTFDLPTVSFDEAWTTRVEAQLDGERVFLIGRDELIRAREASDEPYAGWDAELLRYFRQ